MKVVGFIRGEPRRQVDPDEACARLAAAQLGVLSRQQALACAMTDDTIQHRLRRSRWEKVHPCVYRIAGAAITDRQRLFAAYLWIAQAVVSHRSAGELLGLPVPKGMVELSTTSSFHPRTNEVIVHHARKLAASEVSTLAGLRVTTGTRTIIDLAGVLAPSPLEQALEEALRLRLTTVPELQRSIDGAQRGRRGISSLKLLIAERGDAHKPSESPLETQLFRLLVTAGLPLPVKQYKVQEKGRTIARIDFAYPDLLVAIEADGHAYHSGRQAWQNDRTRRNALTARGWRVVHVTHEDLRRRPSEVIGTIRRALEAAHPISLVHQPQDLRLLAIRTRSTARASPVD